MNDYLNLTNNN